MASSLLALRGVQVDYGGPSVLRIASLEVSAGELLALLGPNGSGKSTLLRVMGLVQHPSAGELYFRGEPVERHNALALRRRIASVFQEPLLLNDTLYNNAALGLRLRGLGRSEIARRLGAWLERLGIAHLRSRPVRTLSGGEAQRTCLARALVLEPEVLLLDEPFSPLDPLSREALLDDLQAILKQTRITTVFVTHNRDEAFTLADRVGVLSAGDLLQLGPAGEVFARPATAQVAELIGVENRLAGVSEAAQDETTTVRVDATEIMARGSMAPGSRVRLCIRSEDIAVRPLQQAPCAPSDCNRLRATVLKISSGLDRCRVTLRTGKITLVASVRRDAGEAYLPKEGEDVAVYFDPRRVHLVPDGDCAGPEIKK